MKSTRQGLSVLPGYGATVPVLTPSNMHAAFDPDSVEVWCDFAGRAANTNDGFCQFCGRTNHQPTKS